MVKEIYIKLKKLLRYIYYSKIGKVLQYMNRNLLENYNH